MSNWTNLTYKQLKEQRNLMLDSMTFSVHENDRDIFQKAIEGIEKEMFRRETKTMVITVNLIVVALILSSCQTFDGVKGDLHWLTADNDHSAQTERK